MQTESLPELPKKRLGPWPMFFLACGLLLVLLVAGLAIAALSWRHRVAARVQSELARIRDAGEPVTAEDLTEYCRLPDGVEDITQLWVQATLPLDGEPFNSDARDLPIVGEDESEIPPPGEPWPKLDAVEQLLAKYQNSLDLLHEAAETPGSACYSTDFSLGLNMPLPEIQRLRAGARLLSLEAHVRAHRGDPHGAAESIHAIFMLARSLDREPILVSQLVRLAIDSIARDLLQRLLGCVDFSDQDLARLQENLRTVDYHEGLHRAMVGERVIGAMAIEDPGSLSDTDIPVNGLLRMVTTDSLAYYLEHMAKLVAATQKPWPEALHAAQQAGDEIDQLGKGGSLTRIRYMLALLLAPALQAVFEATARNVALNGAADAAIAAEEYRRKNGALPERLDQLVPEFLPAVPTDPYDGRPLRYVVREGGYLVYSVGSNCIDEGGLIADGIDGDYVFRVGPARTAE
jgi:hypothetical protein